MRHIRAFGPVVRLELDRVDDGSGIEAHIPRAQFDQLGVTKGQRVFVSPTSVRVFARLGLRDRQERLSRRAIFIPSEARDLLRLLLHPESFPVGLR